MTKWQVNEWQGILQLGLKITVCSPLNAENILSRRNCFGLGPHFCQENKHMSLKKMIIRTTCKPVNCFSNIARLKYLVATPFTSTSASTFIKVAKVWTDITPTNSCAKWEDYTKAWNYIKNDFDRETDQQYSTIVQMIVKANRAKPIACALSLVRWHVITYQTKKKFKFSVCISYPLCSLHSTYCT